MNHALILNPSVIRPLVLRWKFSFKAVWLVGLALVISLIGFYVFQISVITEVSFTVANLEKQIADLDKEFKNLQVGFSLSNSLSGLEAALMANGYEKVGKIHYIQVLEGAVAAK